MADAPIRNTDPFASSVRRTAIHLAQQLATETPVHERRSIERYNEQCQSEFTAHGPTLIGCVLNPFPMHRAKFDRGGPLVAFLDEHVRGRRQGMPSDKPEQNAPTHAPKTDREKFEERMTKGTPPMTNEERARAVDIEVFVPQRRSRR